MLFYFSDSIYLELYRLLIRSRDKNIRVVIRVFPSGKTPTIIAYDVDKPIRSPRMLPIEIREVTANGDVVTKSQHEISYADILLRYDKPTNN
jgi:hypothetical protein